MECSDGVESYSDIVERWSGGDRLSDDYKWCESGMRVNS